MARLPLTIAVALAMLFASSTPANAQRAAPRSSNDLRSGHDLQQLLQTLQSSNAGGAKRLNQSLNRQATAQRPSSTDLQKALQILKTRQGQQQVQEMLGGQRNLAQMLGVSEAELQQSMQLLRTREGQQQVQQLLRQMNRVKQPSPSGR